MIPKVDTGDLAGAADIAAMLGWTTSKVAVYAMRPGFPAPVARLKTGRIWRRSDIEKWARAKGYLDGTK